MHAAIKRTFGGLAPGYYVRQLIFGLLCAGFFFVFALKGSLNLPFILIILISTLLYPYSRFVYESAIGFIFGRNVFFVNVVLMLIVKAFSMMLCWAFAVFIAPIGLAYLFFKKSDH